MAANEGNEVVILCAWGYGTFKNPIEIVSRRNDVIYLSFNQEMSGYSVWAEFDRSFDQRNNIYKMINRVSSIYL